jgi:hypothetical protein
MIDRTAAFARRFLSDRSFTLIVAPALADFEFGAARHRAGDYVAIARALVGAFWEDATADSGALTFLSLVSLPAAYYSVFFMVWQPAGLRAFAARGGGYVLVAILLIVSVIPVAVCYWPDKTHDS